ncbi:MULTISPECIES: protein translocase subunit SecD [Cryobacterium]|uniref:Protein translocase subunit SecD n=1 Tax=Cryobacterium levicorallinum TaxID=995038 RepID=A0A1I3A2N0_9MICO|nr:MULTISPECIES: protein translocase subunit SecD [Cryobacterium]TFB82684.1 protein translocase subunit SecD [Cryobacterium levicorallinum]TFD65973.1 protein translocase subunit SecD [Cryobacterium sp. Hh38]GEP26368.1 protein translocase subunit SecD [Cryobacterium levicorallinum]SFH44422.1 preprotein translocase subunit SecD [Cryobacterium levicorallinum]
MAKSSSPAKKAWRSLTWLGVLIVGLIALNAFGVFTQNGSWTPKLALDLEGGTQIILAPQVESGATVTSEQLTEAVGIIRQRINSSGVSETEVNTQGGQNIVVSIPGTPDDATLERIKSSAKLEFRAVLVAGQPSGQTVGADGTATPAPEATVDPSLSTTPTVEPTDASDLNYVTPALQAEYDAFDCAAINTTNVAPADEPLITCETDGSIKYILGPVEVDGSTITDATNGQRTTSSGATTGEWVVNIVFNSEGTTKFADVTTRLNNLTGAQNQFAIVLDGAVISAPSNTQGAILNGRPEISGSFDQDSSKALADQLKFGALPISFTVQSQDTISATLGSTQLLNGLIAGLIGLILVVMYSLAQYRLLGLVTVASLAVAAVITYLLITILSWREGYRLSLAGVAGLIVAIGITADSFIVYFERVRDELRDGRGLESSVEAGWKRAFRTIVASDVVNFLAAAVLFVLAVGNVRGFALTLGLTTIVDLLVVSMFTHPMLQLVAKTRFFNEGHKLSGLDPRALGAVYRGRARFEPSSTMSARKVASSSKEAAKRQTIAERKASELVSTSTDRSTDGKDS